MVPLIVLIVIVVVGAGVAFLVKSRKAASAASEEAGSGPNEFLQSPPSSFPSSAGSRALAAGDPVAETEPAAEPEAAEAEVDDELEDDEDDEVVVARFKAPGTRAVGATTSSAPIVVPPVYHLEAEPESEPVVAADPEPVVAADPEPVVAAEPQPEPVVEADQPEIGADEPEPVKAEDVEQPEEPEVSTAPALTLVPDSAPSDGPVIDLLGESAVVTPAEPVIMRIVDDAPVAVPDVNAEIIDDEAWEDVVLQPEPDAVDHVLQALINRARFKQVEVEAVATELVERADLQGQEVSEVLAELVGRADDTGLGETRTSELTLFNDEVPSRPGQLTDFARLAPAEKKRIIVRVLCLLVARSEDQQLPPRATDEASQPRSWPLARAVWPLANAEDDGESQLPSRRLAKSG